MDNEVAASENSRGVLPERHPEAVPEGFHDAGDNQGQGPAPEVLRQLIPEQPHESENGQAIGAPLEHQEVEHLCVAVENQLLIDVPEILRRVIPEQPHEVVNVQAGDLLEHLEGDEVDQQQEAERLHIAEDHQPQQVAPEHQQQPLQPVVRHPRYTIEEDHAILNVVANIPLGLKQMKAFDFIRVQTGLNRTSASIYQRFYLSLIGPMYRIKLTEMTDLQKLFIFHYNENLIPDDYRQRLREKEGLEVSSPISDEDFERAMARLVQRRANGVDEQEVAEVNDEANLVVAPAPRLPPQNRALFSFVRNIMLQINEEDREVHADIIAHLHMLVGNDLIHPKKLTNKSAIDLLYAMEEGLRNAEWIK